MNRKYLKHAALMLLFTFISPSSSMDQENVGYGKKIAKTFKAFFNKPCVKYEDVSRETESWARQELRKSNIDNAATVPLKKALKYEGWHVRSNTIFIPETFNPNKCSSGELLEAAWSLKHEVKHFNNKDGLKRQLFVGPIATTGILAALLADKYPRYIPRVTLFVWGLIPLACGGPLFHIRYQEKEADRFAFEHANTRQEIVAVKEKLDKAIVYFEDNLLRNKFYGNKVQRSSYSYIAPIITDINTQLSDNNISDEDKIVLHRKKTKILKMAYFVFDPDHPSLRSRAGMAQDYINKWDREHPGDEKRA